MRARDRRRRGKKASPASDLISKLLDGYHIEDDLRSQRVMTEWKSIVGARFAARTRPDRIDEGVLWIRVSNSAWMQELSFLRDELLMNIQRALGDPPIVTDIRLHLGAARPRHRQDEADARLAKRRTRSRKTEPKRPLPPPASGASLAQIERETAEIEDPELREIIARARRLLDT
jgi:predicted nucleic acid-binding Zn ribbon protein